MKKSQYIISTISLISSILALILSVVALYWIHTNNQREVSTELLLSAKIKCLETGSPADCETAKNYLQDSKDRVIKFDF